MPMPLNQLLPAAESSVLIRELTLDSRKVRPGDLFLAVPGTQQDGRVHIADAIARGAAAVAQCVDRELDGEEDVLVLTGVDRSRKVLVGRCAGKPARPADRRAVRRDGM